LLDSLTNSDKVAGIFGHTLGVYTMNLENIQFDGTPDLSILNDNVAPVSVSNISQIPPATPNPADYIQKNAENRRKSDKETRVLAKAGSHIMGPKPQIRASVGIPENITYQQQNVMNTTTTSISTIIHANAEKPVNLDINAFLEQSNGGKKDIDVINELKKEHAPVMAILSKRQSNMNVVLKYWSQGDTTAAFNALTMMNDPSIIMDVFNTTFAEGQRLDVLTLENVPAVISLSLILIKTKYDCYIYAGLKTIHNVFKIFGDVFFFPG